MEVKIWTHEKLGRWICIDTETTVVDNHLTPDLVLFQAYDGDSAFVVPKEKIEEFFWVNFNQIYIFHNCVFDIDVIEKSSPKFSFTKAIDENRVYDTMVLFVLLHLAHMGFTPKQRSLKFLIKEFFDIELDKNDDIRMNFGRYLDAPLSEIPKEFITYAMNDVVHTYNLFKELYKQVKEKGGENMLTHHIQIKGSIALSRIHKNGIGFSQKKKASFLKKLQRELKGHEEIINKWGFFRGVKGTQTRYEHIVWLHKQLYGISLPTTETGKIVADAENLEPYRDYEFFNALCEFKYLEKTMSFFEGLEGDRVHPRYMAILNTGRTSCAKPNIQQLPRKEGVRQLFVPAKGHVFLNVDYSQLELCTLAQTCLHNLGHSRMAELINEGRDLHKYYASILLGKSEDEITKDERQYAKAANFGFPGGLGIETFITYAKKSYGISDLTNSQAEEMKKAWFKAFPEMETYMKEDKGEAWTITGRLRGNTSFCAEKNTPFQGLAADGAKLALYNVMKAGFKIVGFIHDELLIEHPKKGAEEALDKLEKIMIESMKIVTPDINIKVEGGIKNEFSK